MAQPASDAKIAEFLIKHIDEPCQVEVSPGRFTNLRDFYLREAERVLPTITDPAARDQLQKKVDQFRNP